MRSALRLRRVPQALPLLSPRKQMVGPSSAPEVFAKGGIRWPHAAISLQHLANQALEKFQYLEADILVPGMEAVIAVPIALHALGRLRKELRIGLEKLAVQETVQ